MDAPPGRGNCRRRDPVAGRRRRAADPRLAPRHAAQLHRRDRRRGRAAGQRDRGSRRGVPHLDAHDAPAHSEERGDLHLRAHSRAHHRPRRQGGQVRSHRDDDDDDEFCCMSSVHWSNFNPSASIVYPAVGKL